MVVLMFIRCNLGLLPRSYTNDISYDGKLNSLQPNGKFYQWFVGFSDAEGNFTIQPVYNKDRSKINRFSFMFIIELHIDDLNILTIIKDTLGIGNIRLDKGNNKCTFTVSNKEGILKLIEIFDRFNLNTTKYLEAGPLYL